MLDILHKNRSIRKKGKQSYLLLFIYYLLIDFNGYVGVKLELN